MPREIICPSCQQALRVRDGYAGASMMCPRCSTKVPVPPEDDDVVEAIQDARPAPAAAPAGEAVREGRPRIVLRESLRFFVLVVLAIAAFSTIVYALEWAFIR